MRSVTLSTLPFYFLFGILCLSSCTNNTPKKVKGVVLTEDNRKSNEQGYIEPRQDDTLTTQN
jgi:hypothetical protein